MADSWKIIANPQAGGGKWQKVIPKIESLLDQHKLETEWFYPSNSNETIQIVHKLVRKGNRKFIALGGDGTVHYLINGLFKQAHIPTSEISLAVLPLGTGNDWVRTHKIPTKIERAVALIGSGHTQLQDVGFIRCVRNGKAFESYFINVAGTGFEANAVLKSEDLNKNGVLGTVLYLRTVLKTLWKYRPQIHHIEEEFIQIDQPMLLTTVGIGRFNGGGMQLVPKADPFDGLFDISFVEDLSPSQVLFNLVKLYNGKIYRHKQVHHHRSKNLKVEGPRPILIEADGEILGTTPAEFSILPASLQIVVPGRKD